MSVINAVPCRPAVFLSVAALLLSRSYAAFEGEGTFYGAGGSGEKGACLKSPGFNGVGITVAMNAEQYASGESCGKCIVARGTGTGAGATPILGPIFATIDNECPECKFGDVDFGLGGEGRWRITWDFVDCSLARRSGSHLPTNETITTPTAIDGHGKRGLRGTVELQHQEPTTTTTNYLPPGYMVTSDGIKLISTVVSSRQKASQEAVALITGVPPSGSP